MKRFTLLLFTVLLFSGCYTTLYPPYNPEIADTYSSIPDSTEKIIVNNYYESNEYYQVPNYYRYSFIWNDYYWDPFYYDSHYHNWRPYYWYGSYYYYNPNTDYWFYYRYHDHHPYPGDNGGSTVAPGTGERVRKPGYSQLMSTPTPVAPFTSVSGPVGKPGYNSGNTSNNSVSVSGRNQNYTQPRVQSVGKKTLGGQSSSSSYRVEKKQSVSSGSSSSSSHSKSTHSSSSYSKPSYKKQSVTSSSNNKSSSNTNSKKSKE